MDQFKAPEPAAAGGETTSTVTQSIPEESDEEEVSLTLVRTEITMISNTLACSIMMLKCAKIGGNCWWLSIPRNDQLCVPNEIKMMKWDFL